jgi:hypothetical protein
VRKLWCKLFGHSLSRIRAEVDGVRFGWCRRCCHLIKEN